jgi:hypothetical protein
MWTDITRGVAALKSVWSLDAAGDAMETIVPAQDLRGDFLAEAENYLNNGRHQSAAIMAGDALESTLRTLCASNSVLISDKASMLAMNEELARNGIYDNAVEQRVSAAATLSDKANCGLWSDFTKEDVEIMLAEVRAFAEEHHTL